MEKVKKLKFFSNGKWLESKAFKYMPVYNPSTGEVQAEAPCCTQEEVEEAIAAAHAAYPEWAATPVVKRVQVLYKFRDLIIEHEEELTEICAREHGKNWQESAGDIGKVKEPVELACGTPNLMMGESLMNTSPGFDTVMYREPLGYLPA